MPKTRTKTDAKTIHKIKDNDEDIDKDKAMSECKYGNMLTKVYFKKEMKLIDNHWTRKKNFNIFLNNNTISEICEKWIFYNDSYAYRSCEALHTRLGELLYIREHKASLSKEKSHAYIDIDELKMYSDDDDDESTFQLKEYRVMIDKIYDKMSNINELISIIKKINDELKKNIKSIYELNFKLSDDSRLRQVEINTINAKVDDTLNFVCNKIYRKNRIRSKKVDIFKLISLERMHKSLNDISEIKNEIFMIYMNMLKLYENYAIMDVDDLHLINDELTKIMIQLKQDLK